MKHPGLPWPLPTVHCCSAWWQWGQPTCSLAAKACPRSCSAARSSVGLTAFSPCRWACSCCSSRRCCSVRSASRSRSTCSAAAALLARAAARSANSLRLCSCQRHMVSLKPGSRAMWSERGGIKEVGSRVDGWLTGYHDVQGSNLERGMGTCPAESLPHSPMPVCLPGRILQLPALRKCLCWEQTGVEHSQSCSRLQSLHVSKACSLHPTRLQQLCSRLFTPILKLSPPASLLTWDACRA